MNTHPHRPADEAAQLARLLPAPAVHGLSADRHRMLREQLMQQLQEPSTGTATPERPRLTRRRVLWGLAPLTAVAAAVATVLAIGAYSGGTSGGAGSGSAVPDGAAPLLERMALAAESQPANAVRDDQFVYIKSMVAFVSYGPNNSVNIDSSHERQVWLSVDGTKAGRLIEHGSTDPLDADTSPNLNAPTYRYLESLPTDPDALLAKIYAESGGTKNPKEQEAFVTIGDLLRESIAPPKVTAALYRAAAKIPGVVVVKDVTDAAGRHGVAVARLDTRSGIQQEWIFNSSTSTYLGESDVQVTKSAEGVAAGTVLGQAAVLERAVVDSIGQTG